MKDLSAHIVDQETKSRATPSSRRRDSRIEELTNQLHFTNKDKGDTTSSSKSNLQRSPGKSQHPAEADRQKTKDETQIGNMRRSMDAMVC